MEKDEYPLLDNDGFEYHCDNCGRSFVSERKLDPVRDEYLCEECQWEDNVFKVNGIKND